MVSTGQLADFLCVRLFVILSDRSSLHQSDQLWKRSQISQVSGRVVSPKRMKVPKGGGEGRVTFNPKIYVVDFGP